jgi:hypothetical protein
LAIPKIEPFHFFDYLPTNKVARWFIFKPKIPIWVKFGGPWKGKFCHIFMTTWNISVPFGTLHGRLVQFVVVWVYLSRFGKFGPRQIWQPWLELKVFTFDRLIHQRTTLISRFS